MSHLRSDLDSKAITVVRELDNFQPRPTVDAQIVLEDGKTINRHSNAHLSIYCLNASYLHRVHGQVTRIGGAVWLAK